MRQIVTEDPGQEILTPAQVAALFKVDSKTITRWAQSGKLKSFKTLGGHRRYRRSDIEAALNEMAAAEPVRDGTLCGDKKGTDAGHSRHKYYGDVPCYECRLAHAAEAHRAGRG